jgi:hypothetical protein
MVPPKSYEKAADLEPTLTRYARLFDLGAIGSRLGYPLFMKPYDGGGWVGVTKIDDEAALRAAYEASGTKIMHLQKGVIPYDRFVRCIGFGPQTRLVNYDPAAPLHDRYRMDRGFVSDGRARELEAITLTINAFFGWDFNSCEALLKGDDWHPIDFANACPDSQVTSLHYHFPWLVKANLRWSLYCAATRRPMRVNLDWQPYFEAAAREGSYAERLAAYAALASRSSARGTSRTSMRSPTSSSRARPRALPCAPRSRRCTRRTRWSSSRISSGSGSSSGGAPRRLPPEAQDHAERVLELE